MNSKDESFSIGEDYYKRSGEIITVYLHTYMKIVQTFIECLELAEGEALTLRDLGALGGYLSLNMVAHIIDLLKKKSNHVVPSKIVYEDLHCNNFNTLVKTLKAGHQLLDKHNVFVSMCPVTFYNQCQPENTFHIIMCTFSAHLLSRSVCYKNSLYNHPDATPEERKAAKKQAAADWITFLCLRAKELKSAMLMLTMPVEDQKNSHVHLERLWTVMTEVWRQMKVEEHISEVEYETTNYQGYYRSEEELRAPFQEGSTVHSAGLYIQSLDIVHRHNYSRLCLSYDLPSEAERQYSWANTLTQIVRDWTEYIFLEALDQRSASSKRKLIDTFYTRLVDKLKCEDREGSGWVNIICYLVIRKR